MADPTCDPENPKQAVVWYKSRIVVGIATIVATRLLDYAQKQFHIDASAFGITVNDLVSLILNVIAGVSAWVALHARVAPSVPIPPVVTLTQSSAAAVNATPPQKADAPSTNGVSNEHSH
jgi:hypothetical protein